MKIQIVAISIVDVQTGINAKTFYHVCSIQLSMEFTMLKMLKCKNCWHFNIYLQDN